MPAEYRLLTYKSANGASQAGIKVGDRVIPTASLLGGGGMETSSVYGLLQAWDSVHPRLQAAAASVGPSDGQALADVSPLPPIIMPGTAYFPGTLFCAGSNYWDHKQEMAEILQRQTGKAPEMKKLPEPWFFIKTANSVIGPNDPIRLPPFSKKVHWEAEIGVVIGRPTYDISEERAYDAIAGYVIVNDMSANDLTKREGSPFIFDWYGGKCFDCAAPMGPWITPAAYIRDPQDISIKLWRNGAIKQNSNSNKMVHGIAEQIAYLSRHNTLRPGDVIATGTPAGVGAPHGEFLQPGDEIRIELAGREVMVNPVVAG